MEQNKVMDSDLIKRWQGCLDAFKAKCLLNKVYGVEKFIKEAEVPYSREFRRLMAYLIKEKKVKLEGKKKPVYTFLAKIENKYIQEWYADYRLKNLMVATGAKPVEEKKKPTTCKESPSSPQEPPTKHHVYISYDPSLNDTGLPDEDFGVISWLKVKGYKVSKLVEKVF